MLRSREENSAQGGPYQKRTAAPIWRMYRLQGEHPSGHERHGMMIALQQGTFTLT